jgi:hypothetical protein
VDAVARSDRRVALTLGVPLALAVLFSWGRIALERDDVPRDEDYAAARAQLDRDGFRPRTDALAILPPWSLRPLVTLGDLEPLGSDALSTQLLERYARLFVVVEPDAGEQANAIVARLGPPQTVHELGRVTLWRFDLPAPNVTFDLRERLRDARVRIVGGAGEVVCVAATARDGFACPERPAWQRVTREWLLVSENADDAVWSHPPPRGERLEIAWDAVPMGASLALRLGHTRDGADHARAPVRVRVVIDGKELTVLERAPRFSFDTHVVDTRAYLGRTAALALVIDSDDESSNHFAWDGVVRSGP